jgi:hypothetical protein
MSENIHDTLLTSASVSADPFLTDPAYRHEARQALNAHLEACFDALQQAGVTPPEWPTLDDQTVSGLAAQMLWLNRWLIDFDPATMKPQLSPVPTNAFVLTKDQIQKNLEEILPGYRLIEQPLYEQLTVKQNERFLQVDFNHRICSGIDLEDEFIGTLKLIQEELSGLFGALTHLLQTTEENRLGASIAGCIAQKLNEFGLLVTVKRENAIPDDFLDKVKASYAELYRMNGFLIESMDDSEKYRFGYSLVLTADQKFSDIQALLDAYTQQSQTAAKAGEAGAQ